MKMDSEGLPDREDLLRKCRAKNKTLLDVGTGPIALIAAKEFNCQVTNIVGSTSISVKNKPLCL